jgi:hypothetical protein
MVGCTETGASNIELILEWAASSLDLDVYAG